VLVAFFKIHKEFLIEFTNKNYSDLINLKDSYDIFFEIGLNYGSNKFKKIS